MVGPLAAALTAVMVLAGCTGQPGDRPTSTPPPTAATAAAAGFDAATADDEAFNAAFTHEFAQVEGVRMHYVTGGSGPPLVLLHGWPQTWYSWWPVMPALAEDHTVYALDLPGLGDSQGSPSGYDKATLARYVHTLLVDELGLPPVALVAHDLGAGVGFQYASQFPEHLTHYAHLDYPLPGRALDAATYRTFSWHLAFHSQPDVPEAVVDPEEVREYLALFYPQVAYGGTAFGGPGAASPFTEAQVDEYARTYARPEVLEAGLGLYRSLDRDAQDNTAAAPVSAPTLLLSAEGGLALAQPTLQGLVVNVERAVEVPGAGHWLVEENPDFVTAELLAFLGR